MYKLCFLLACFACDSHGRRLKVALDQDFSSQDAAGQQLMKQQSWKAGSSAHVKANRSGSRQFGEVMPDPRKAATILLTFLFPAAVFAPMTLSAPGLFKQAYVRQFRQQWDGTAFDSPALVARQAERDAATSASTRGSSQSNVADTDSEPLAVAKNNSSSIHATPEVWGPTVRVFVCVYWEGLYLLKQNLRFFNAFREAHPDVALTHFMNAAYFTKSEVQSMHESGAYQAFGPADEVGIQVNGLKSLVESSGVQYRSDHLGHDPDLRAYSVDELRAMISKSKAILEEQGLKVGESFRAGSWLAGPNVLEAFRREGFRVNSSAVGLGKEDGKLSMAEKIFWRDTPLTAVLHELWPGITKESQPFILDTPGGQVLEMPDTGGSAGHATGHAKVEDVVEHIGSAVQRLDSEDRFAHIGFHQETAAAFGPRVIAAVTEIKRKYGQRVVFETLQASAGHARSMQRLMELEVHM